MSQFDSETAAALARLEFEELSTVPGGEFAEIIGDLVALAGTGGLWAAVGGVSSILLKVRKLAGSSYASNLIYAITAVRNELATLYQQEQRLRKRIETLPEDPKFAEAVSALALRAMQTSVKDRLKRLARIVVNGVKEADLEPESLDDMMRAAVELTQWDVSALGIIFERQKHLLTNSRDASEWSQQISLTWGDTVQRIGNTYLDHLRIRAALSRLQSAGLIAAVQTNHTRTGTLETQPFGLLSEGMKFFERLQEIGTN